MRGPRRNPIRPSSIPTSTWSRGREPVSSRRRQTGAMVRRLQPERARMTDVLMPALSPTMEEGTLAKWHVKVGDQVKSGDVIAEIETDKATMEVEAVDEGKVEA